MSTTEVARALRITDINYVYRLASGGAITGRKTNGRWAFDAASVAAYVARVSQKRSSRTNAANERAKRMAEAESRFAA